MVTLKGAFNAEEHTSDYTLIEPGKYTAMVIGSENWTGNNGDAGVTLRYKIMNGEFANSVFTQNYAIFSANNPKRLQASQGSFARICNACQCPLIQDTAQLHNIVIGIEVSNTESAGADGQPRKYNNIVRAWSIVKPAQSQPQPPILNGNPPANDDCPF